MIDDAVEIIYVVLRIDLVIRVSYMVRNDPAARADLTIRIDVAVAIWLGLRTYCIKSSSATRAILTV